MSHKSPQRCNLSPYNSSKGNYWSSNRKSSPFGISGVSMCTRELSRSPFRSPSRTQRSFCSTTPKKSHQVQILYDRTSQYNIPPTSQTSKKCSGIFTQLIKTHNLQQKNPKISTTNHKNTKINQNLYCFHGNQHKKEEQNGGSYGKYHNCYGKISFSMFKEQNRSMVKKNQVSENVNVFQSFGSPSHCNMKEDNVYFISDFVTEQPFIQNDPHLTQQPQKEQQNVLISSFEQAITLIRKASQKTEPFPSDSMIDDNVQMSIEKGKFGQSFNMDPFM